MRMHFADWEMISPRRMLRKQIKTQARKKNTKAKNQVYVCDIEDTIANAEQI